jgi:hypothetical protein
MPLKTRDTLSSNSNFNAQGIELQKTQLTHLSNLSSAVSNGTMAISGTISGGGDASATNQLAMLTSLQSLDSKTSQMTSDGTGALIVRLDNGNDSVRIVGQNTAGSNKGVGVEDTDGAILGGAKVLVADPTSSDGSRQVLRMNVKNELLTSIGSVNGNLNVKLEDLSSSIDAEHANNSRSLPTTMKARQIITDETSGKYLLCSSLGELKVQINEIKAGILNSINTHNTNKNTYTQVLTNVSKVIGQFAQSTAIEVVNNSDGTGTSNSVLIYINTGAGTDTSKFSFEVHKSYDNTSFFLDSNFSFTPMPADINANAVPAVLAKGGFDARFIQVKVNNLSEANTTSINAYIFQRH